MFFSDSSRRLQHRGSCLFRYLALALAISPVVDNENVETEPVEYFDGLKAVRNIASITMKKKEALLLRHG